MFLGVLKIPLQRQQTERRARGFVEELERDDKWSRSIRSDRTKGVVHVTQSKNNTTLLFFTMAPLSRSKSITFLLFSIPAVLLILLLLSWSQPIFAMLIVREVLVSWKQTRH